MPPISHFDEISTFPAKNSASVHISATGFRESGAQMTFAQKHLIVARHLSHNRRTRV